MWTPIAFGILGALIVQVPILAWRSWVERRQLRIMLLLIVNLNPGIPGRDLAKKFERYWGRNISYVRLYSIMSECNLLRMVIAKDTRDADGLIRSFTLTPYGKEFLYPFA